MSDQSREEGAAAAEFAFVLPFLVILLLGIVQFGLVTYRHQVLEGAAREAARVASVGAPQERIAEVARASATGFHPETVGVTSVTCADVGQGGNVTVVLEVDEGVYDFTIPFLPDGAFQPVYRAGASYRCESNP